MLDFMTITTKINKSGVMEISPKFIIKKSKDLMIRGGDFYAIWNEPVGLWSTDEQDVIHLVDQALDEYAEKFKSSATPIKIQYMWDAESGVIDKWHKYCQKQLRDNYHMLDEKLIWKNDSVKKEDYASKILPYPLIEGSIESWDKLIGTLYVPEERHKLEWAIGSIVTGDSKHIQKFMVLYGSAGTGKSTILNIIQNLFDGYYSVFDARALGSSSNSFALESFKSNPLVAIQHDGDLSRIEDNTRLNSLVSHELMTVNEKFKSAYNNRFKAFLFMGTNKPVKITDAKSGLIRRLIDVTPSGEKLSRKEYDKAMHQIPFELGAIAMHCKNVYLDDTHFYDDYVPLSMLSSTNDFYNFVLDNYFTFSEQKNISLKQAWDMYKVYVDDAKIPYPLSKRVFKEELKNYFEEYLERGYENGERFRNYYKGFIEDKFEKDTDKKVDKIDEPDFLQIKETESIFDSVCKDYPAQYADEEKGTPKKAWDYVKTTLKDIDTTKLHYVRVPENHIVIDFDLRDETGEKKLEVNLEAASKFPKTYCELSKSGNGVHLHYIYNGDVKKLSSVYSDHIEIKVYSGKSALRRKLTLCNDYPIATISSGLPLKGDDKVVNFGNVKNEKAIRTLIAKNLKKEIHPGTKPSVDFIKKILDDAYISGIPYNVEDLKPKVLAFAAASTNQAPYCIKLVGEMKWKSEKESEPLSNDDKAIIFYDIEVFPNLFLVNWKKQGEGNPVVRMINPTAHEVEDLFKYRLIGFNCRRYDNHILYARYLGYNNKQLYALSQRIITEGKGFFSEAYNISYTDVYDFSTKKQSLKKWEIELGIHHKELGLPWNEPVPEDKWELVAEYCDNDVLATEAVFNHLKGDWTARQILADLAGMSVNDTSNSLTTRIIFGRERKPKLVYTDLATGEQY